MKSDGGWAGEGGGGSVVLYGHQYFYSGLFFLDKKGFLLSNLPNKPYFSLSLYLYYCNFNI